MKRCDCEIIITDNLELEARYGKLIHKTCDGVYDPAFILREKRSDRTGVVIPGAEYR
jgi:hypothetical protein